MTNNDEHNGPQRDDDDEPAATFSLVYDRLLSDDEIETVKATLAAYLMGAA